MGELLGLEWEDVDWATKGLHVRRQLQRVPRKGFIFTQPQTEAGRRVIQLGPNSMGQRLEHRNRQDIERKNNTWQEYDLMFPSSKGTPTCQRNIHRSFKSML